MTYKIVLKVIKFGEDRLNRFLRYLAKTLRGPKYPPPPPPPPWSPNRVKVTLVSALMSTRRPNGKRNNSTNSRNCSPFHGFWQSFVSIGSCNHLMRVISTYVGNTKKSEVTRRCRLFKRDNQLSNIGCKKTWSYFLLVANNKTKHSPTSSHCYFYALKFFKNFDYRYYLVTFIRNFN